MSKRVKTALSVLLLGFAVTATGTAVAGDGKSCGGKKKGESAAVVVPSLPQG